MILIKTYKRKKTWFKKVLKENKIRYFSLLNYILILDTNMFLFLFPKETFRLEDNSIFFEFNDPYLLHLKNVMYSNNYYLLNLKKEFDKNNNYYLVFKKEYEYYNFIIKDKKYNTELFKFIDYSKNLNKIKLKIEEFNKKKLKMNNKLLPIIEENLKKGILSGYDIDFKNYDFELENENDIIYTAIFENSVSGNLIVVKKIKINLLTGEILFAGEINNALSI